MSSKNVFRDMPCSYSDSDGGSGVAMVRVFERTSRGDNTPNFRNHKLRPRPLPVNSYNAQSWSLTPNVRRTDYFQIVSPTYTAHSWTMDATLDVHCSPDTLLKVEAEAKATAEIMSKIKDLKVNLAQACAEANQTANLFAVTARRITGAFTALRKGNIKKAASVLGIGLKAKTFRRYTQTFEKDPKRAAANAWLELQYGWKPLLQDVYGAAQLIGDTQRDSPLYQEVSVTSSCNSHFVVPTVDSREFSENLSSTENSTTVRCRIGITYEVVNSPFRDVSKMGLTDPALLAWELLPYSFVVDWFLPVGSWLENATAFSGVEFIRGFVSTKLTAVGTYTESSKSWSETTRGSRTIGGGSKTYKTFSRRPMVSFPTNPLPTIKSPASVGHALNALALLTTAFRR